MRRLRKRYGHSVKKTKHQLLRDAMRDWRARRAYYRNGRYYLRPIGLVAGIYTVLDQRSRKVAPWSKEAVAEWKDPSGLHTEAVAAYPDPVNRHALIQKIVEEEGLS